MYKQLAYEESVYIETALQSNRSIVSIATDLKRSISTLRREIKRNLTQAGNYTARHAEQFYRQRQRQKPTQCKLTAELWANIEAKLWAFWRPEQIVHRLNLPISVKSVYAYLHRHFKRKHPIWQCLRRGKKRYIKRKTANDGVNSIVHRVSIHERPKIVDEKARIGDGEVDTLQGKGHYTAIATLVERKTKLTKLVRVFGKNAEDLADKVIAVMLHLKAKVKTLTFDNGKEFSAHRKLAEALECETYFADAHRPWPRGLNENTNGLIRQYFPKGSDLSEITQADVERVKRALNARPWKTSGYQSPHCLVQLGGNKSYPLVAN